MALTISPSLISDTASGYRNLTFRDVGSAASSIAFSKSSIQASTDHIALSAGARLATQSADYKQGIANASKAASLLQVADKAVDEIDTRLARLQELAADASLTELSEDRPAPELVSDRDRAMMNAEFAVLRSEIDAIARDTSFDGTTLLDGLSVTFTVGGGGQSGDSIAITLAAADSASLAAGLDTADISTLASSSAALTLVNTAIGAAGNISTAIRGAQERFGFAANSLSFAASVADTDRAGRLTPDVTLDISHLAASQSLEARGIDPATVSQSLERSLLNTFVVDTTTTETGEADESNSTTGVGQTTDGSNPAKRSSLPKAQPKIQDQSVSLTV